MRRARIQATRPQQFLYFFPLLQGRGSLRPLSDLGFADKAPSVVIKTAAPASSTRVNVTM